MEESLIEIKNDLQELHRINEVVDSLEDKGLPTATVMQVNLCLEEAITNIITYAFPGSEEQTIRITIKYNSKEIQIKIEDNGMEFNPLEEVKAPNTEANLDEREIGGLGVFIIKQLMDDVKYNRSSDLNTLEMIKQL